MAYSYGRKYYKKKYGYKSYGRKKYYRKASLYKQMRAISAGTSSTLVQVTRSGMTAFTFAADSNTSNVLTICPWGCPQHSANFVTWSTAINSPLYKTYANLFDEVKLERMEISLAPARSMVSGETTLMIYSALDRKFTRNDSVQSVAQLTQASGVVVRNIQPASTIPFKRVAYARDLQERTTYYDSTPEQLTAGSTTIDRLKAWVDSTNGFVGFSPAFSYGMLSTVASSSQVTLAYVLTIKYYLRFRNPKTELSADAVPVVQTQSMSNGKAVLNLNPLHNDVVVEESKDADSTVK
ncbi:putative Rep [Dolmedivirus noldo]|uniref:Putative Rep n=1 Tax=Circular ssDNA virus sp. TaxID=2805939 RepID=A0A1W5PVL5_9VIRU|nr:putative Rep [Circular ssDNA virus sp.]